MFSFFIQLIEPKSKNSLSRFLYLIGFICMSVWITIDLYNTSELKYDVLAVYAGAIVSGYLGKQYIVSKRNDNVGE